MIPYDVARTSANVGRGRHWGKEHREEVDAAQIAVIYWLLAGEPNFGEGPISVLWVLYRDRKLDADNAIRGCKKLQDALMARRPGARVLAGGAEAALKSIVGTPGRMLFDDHPRYLRDIRVVQVTDPRWKGNAWVECVVIDARDTEEASADAEN